MRLFTAFVFLVFSICFTALPVGAKVYIDLTAPSIKRLPLAIQELRYLGSDPFSMEERAYINATGQSILSTLKKDMDFSGIFKVLNNEAFLEEPEEAGFDINDINFKDWRMIGADALVEGRFRLQEKRLVVEVRLFDTVRQTMIASKRFIGNPKRPERLAHFISDRLYEEITGRKGIFTTKLLFVSKKKGNKEIYLSDYDGGHMVPITDNGSINLSPRWSPDGAKMIYTSYKRGYPYLYLFDIKTGHDEVISKKRGINIGGRFSPDGKSIALTLSTSSSPDLFLLRLFRGNYERLTSNYGIDVSPTWSPDGRKIAFVSDRSGNPHIFVLDLPTKRTKRLSYGGTYNASPAWSPDGKKIAYARADKGGFNIWVVEATGGRAVQLTFDGNNKSPSWSPDGRFIVFTRISNGMGSIYVMQADGTALRKISTGTGAVSSPSWSPFLN
ncbi:MAG: Tol-Pal system beta propeller repeat protein TolB [Thermodesulfobacteriota bacterium]